MYLFRYYWSRPNVMKLKELLSTENIKVLLNLAIYTEKAFKTRTLEYSNR